MKLADAQTSNFYAESNQLKHQTRIPSSLSHRFSLISEFKNALVYK
jgi:hypothetical protein